MKFALSCLLLASSAFAMPDLPDYQCSLRDMKTKRVLKSETFFMSSNGQQYLEIENFELRMGILGLEKNAGFYLAVSTPDGFYASSEFSKPASKHIINFYSKKDGFGVRGECLQIK